MSFEIGAASLDLRAPSFGNPRAKSQEPRAERRDTRIGNRETNELDRVSSSHFQAFPSYPSVRLASDEREFNSIDPSSLSECPTSVRATPTQFSAVPPINLLVWPDSNPAFTFILALSPAPPPTSSHVNLLSLQREQIYVCPTGRPKERAQVNRRIVSSSCGANLVACAPTCI